MADTKKTILVAGGAGYIGSHTVLELLNADYDVVVVDDLSNSCEEGLKRVEELTGKTPVFHKLDMCDRDALEEIFKSSPKFHAAVHFAGLKAVGESVAIPLKYYKNNLVSTINLVELMAQYGCKNLVFSSSATVYGNPEYLPLTEAHPLRATNPYGRTKLFIEDILRDVHVSDGTWNIVLLRYFNPTGAHPSGRIGEDPNGPPNNLMPYVSQVAVGRRECLSVFGDDYDTKDGTGVRDYIHVVDLALGHLAAIARCGEDPGCVAYNLGTGTGYSVLEMVAAFEKASGNKIAYKICPRRPGDVGSVYAETALANSELKWEAKRGLEEMCADMWKWQSDNPKGFAAE